MYLYLLNILFLIVQRFSVLARIYKFDYQVC